MNTCPCCSNSLLRYFRHGSIYLFCRTCWAEMPDLSMKAGSLVSLIESNQRPATSVPSGDSGSICPA